MFINFVQYCILFIKCTTFIQLYLFFPFLTYVNVLKSVSELNSWYASKHDAYKIVVLSRILHMYTQTRALARTS